MTNSVQALFLSHGGGPLPLLGDPGHAEMVACLQGIAARMPRPRAIVVASAHWEASQPTLTAGAQPPLIYDYYGFPEAAYSIRYPCPGDPVLAQTIRDLLDEAGMHPVSDAARGFDHGVFVPLKIMYPEAGIPCVQVSLLASLDPAEHLRMGQALGHLGEDILLVGSGFSFHNLRAFFAAETPESRERNRAFEVWLHETCTRADYSEAERERRLVHWAAAPGARFCHPREEHLLPLHVCYGAARTACRESFELRIMNRQASMYLW